MEGVTLEDAGLGKMASSKKDFIGNVLRKRPAMTDTDRPRLVGFFQKIDHKLLMQGLFMLMRMRSPAMVKDG